MTDERQSLRPEDPCAPRVSTAWGHLHEMSDGKHRHRGALHLARISHQSDNQVIWGSRKWNHEGKGADGAGVSDLWESKRVSCRMVGLRIA